jgi:Asp-tRNA(Asn)/Glu-tRNA(Gln) amidotransferase A subunit family amidase
MDTYFEASARTLAPARRRDGAAAEHFAALASRYDADLKFSRIFAPSAVPVNPPRGSTTSGAAGGAAAAAAAAEPEAPPAPPPLPPLPALPAAAPKRTPASETIFAPPSGPLKGALAGVPFVISPVLKAARAPTHGGSAALDVAGPLATQDAAAIAALRGAGAVLLGVTSATEFGRGAQHAGAALAKHPFSAIAPVPGAASGAAAAVTTRLVPIALAIDSAGEARVSAAVGGCVAFRPT